MTHYQLQSLMANGVQPQNDLRMQEQQAQDQQRSSSIMSTNGLKTHQAFYQATTLADPMTRSQQPQQEFDVGFTRPQQPQNGTSTTQKQAFIRSQQHLGVNEQAGIQEYQNMCFQNQPSSQLFPTHLQAMRQDGTNGAQYSPNNTQLNPQPLSPPQTVSQASPNNGVQMHCQDGAHAMHSSPLTQAATPNAQRPAMTNGPIYSSTSQPAHVARLQRKIDAVRQQMAQTREQRTPQPSSMPLNGTPDLNRTLSIDPMTGMPKLPVDSQMQRMQQNTGLGSQRIDNSQVCSMSTTTSQSQGPQSYLTPPQGDVDHFPEFTQIGVLASENATGWEDSFVNNDWSLENMSQFDMSNTPTLINPIPSTRANELTHYSPVPRRIACLNCHQNWWHDTCEGQPCTNCEGRACLRPKCAQDSVGTCEKGTRCKMVHRMDTQYYDPYLILLHQLPRRRGGKKACPAPSVLGKRKA